MDDDDAPALLLGLPPEIRALLPVGAAYDARERAITAIATRLGDTITA
jgi:hypothetical protein